MNGSTLRRNLTKKPKEPTETPIYRLELINKNSTDNATHQQPESSQRQIPNETGASENGESSSAPLSFDDLESEFTDEKLDRKPSYEHEPLVSVLMAGEFGAIGERRVSSSPSSPTEPSVSELIRFWQLPQSQDEGLRRMRSSTMRTSTSTEGPSCSSQPTGNSVMQIPDLYGNIVNFPTSSGSTSPPHPENSRKPRRRNCCSFCFGLASTKAKKVGLPPPEKDDEGPWSDHSIMIGKAVTCPVLYKITCELCGATKENAHTTYFCPLNRQNM